MAVRSGSRHVGKRITGKKNVRRARIENRPISQSSVTIICTCIIAQKGNKMKGYWIVTIIQERQAKFGPFEETLELHCDDLTEAQGTINNLKAVWPYGWPEMKVKIEWHEVEPNTDTIPDTDFMEGGDS